MRPGNPIDMKSRLQPIVLDPPENECFHAPSAFTADWLRPGYGWRTRRPNRLATATAAEPIRTADSLRWRHHD